MKKNIHLGSRQKATPSQILYLKAESNYTQIYFNDGSQLLSSTTFGKLEQRLDSFDFFRANRSTIINLNHLKNFKIFSEKKGLFFENSSQINTYEIQLSRRRADAFMESLNHFKF
ncbi:MAG: two-component system LytT family response regulator [Arcticibacterium sp.]|jgi:two-component system LytT family response regulator